MMGVIIALSGILAAMISFEPSRLLQYIFVVTALAIGIFGVVIGTDAKKDNPIPSSYYPWIGFILIGLSAAVVIWGTSLLMLAYLLGFFLFLLGMVEFVFALQVLDNQPPIPWGTVGRKIALSATTAIGSAWLLALAGLNMYTVLLFIGVLYITVGLTVIRSAVYR